MPADETTPLLPGGSGAAQSPRPPAATATATATASENGSAKLSDQQLQIPSSSWLDTIFHVENRILLAGFLISLSFSFTQVPLVINIIAGEVVTPVRRTAVFGMLQGCFMFGQSLGNFTGGFLGDTFGIRAPFDVACGFFLLSCVYVLVSLPYIPPPVSTSKSSKRSSGFLAPLRILVPQNLRLASGKMTKHYGVIFLCAGIFLGVLATDYAPLLIQMYATAAFNFNQASNGLLMSEFALMRGMFLLFIFPRIIMLGRRLLASKRTCNKPRAASEEGYGTDGTLTPDSLPTDPREFDSSMGTIPSDEPVKPARSKEDEDLDPQFDLTFLRWSLIVDGGFTTVAAFATKPWHIYLAAFLLPFGSGSAPAAKGVITSMCPDSQRADALNAVTLVENIARLSTQGLFGFVFAALANVGKAYATFFCNAAIAVVAMSVLLLSHFPPEGSIIVDSICEGDEQAEEE
ncbi:Major facilitator superfamily transporter [Cordyceps fumosorosea ARSEF 2679]|uniref:Major facilitator superfamily transporter n=1 Tax=Cordyceps fumosorosea (strain ARSEF 2679) TaxID=1081104 RepID=A0A168BYQ3_CORFA|nr:Major facilitator superfamily transporter [Cordyceps fumosorosea ARSEF 2679]OAA70717.1 Major facilitator superfamily transporter [Cordyceps fumosorosea ARSEF 2679]